MSEAIHLQNYQRFFAVLFSVIPGLNLVVGLAGLVLFLISVVADAEWGLGVGIAALVFAITAIIWIFLGIGVRSWAEQKPTGLLVGLCAPFLIVDAVFMAWLFYDVAIADHTPAAAESAMRVVEVLSAFV